MAIKVLKPGILPSEVFYVTHCHYCRCRFAYQLEDVVPGDQRDVCAHVPCPTPGCGRTPTHLPSSAVGDRIPEPA